MKGYKTVRTQYIDFVKKYNTSKTAGTIIALTPVEQEAMNNLHALWKMASLEKTENGGDYYFDMKDHHDQLQGKFSMTLKTLFVQPGSGIIILKVIQIGGKLF